MKVARRDEAMGKHDSEDDKRQQGDGKVDDDKVPDPKEPKPNPHSDE